MIPVWEMFQRMLKYMFYMKYFHKHINKQTLCRYKCYVYLMYYTSINQLYTYNPTVAQEANSCNVSWKDITAVYNNTYFSKRINSPYLCAIKHESNIKWW